MNRIYYRLWYRLDGTDGYLIWFSNDNDGIVTELNGTVPSFRDQESLYAYAASHQIEIDAGEPLLHDLDIVARWLSNLPSTEIDCDAFLTAWNLFHDLATSVNSNFDRDRERTQHVKKT